MGASGDSQRLRVVMFNAMSQEIAAFEHQLKSTLDANLLDIAFVSSRLNFNTATLASGARVISLFTTDYVDVQMLTLLHRLGVELITLRYAGVSPVDVEKAAQLGIRIVNTPAHAHVSIAEYIIALMLCLNRKVHVGSNRVRDGNFRLDGLMGIGLENLTVGIIGTGDIGLHVARILRGFSCNILAFDLVESQKVKDLGISYVSESTILSLSDILTLHASLLQDTRHLINSEMLSRCKVGVRIITTGVEGLIDTRAAIDALRSGKMGGLAMDVFEDECNMFSKDCTQQQTNDFQLLQSMPNALITRHQSMLTKDAVEGVVRATVKTLLQFRAGK